MIACVLTGVAASLVTALVLAACGRLRRKRRKAEWTAASEPEPRTYLVPFLGNAPSETETPWRA